MNQDRRAWLRDQSARLLEAAAPLGAAEREAYLAGECDGDSELLAEVRALLSASDSAEGFLCDAENLPDTDRSAPCMPHPKQIGHYRILQEIGDGGFGVVYLAEQQQPVRRRVALKVVKPGMDTRHVLARFEAERQALAMMDHPNIAKVFDAGATDSGRPYFVMELVDGVPITEFCDRQGMSCRDRLKLFMQVCSAVQHAHQKGIIHRDIKPSNVLVTQVDDVPSPKIIDFGIAKAMNTELTTMTLFTEHRQMVGTPAYMSPEQVEMSAQDIDTRSDIYSLGVLLYELLTGTTPFGTEELLRKGYAEMMWIIREVEPHKPSLRLSSLGKTATRTAQLRCAADPRELGTLLSGDLDWIVMKCLEKERDLRYDSASSLGADIQRHLTDQPVAARPPSAAYKLRKFVKRNRAQVIAGSIVAAVLVLGVIGTTTGLVWALNEKERADGEADRAERELARATEIRRLLTDMLTGVSPQEAQGADTTLLRRILEDAAGRLAAGEITNELVAAELHHVVGTVYMQIGLYTEAEQHTRAAVEIRTRLLGAEDPDTLRSRHNLEWVYLGQSRNDEAEMSTQETLAIRRRVLGEEHPDTLGSLHNLAVAYHNQGRRNEAEGIYRKVLDVQRRVLGEEHGGTLLTLFNLGLICELEGRYAEAEQHFIKVLETQRRLRGDEHPDTFAPMHYLAVVYQQQGRYAEAEALMLDAYDKRRRVLGESHPDTLGSVRGLAWLARLYQQQGRLEESDPRLGRLINLQIAAADAPDASAEVLNYAAWLLVTSNSPVTNAHSRALAYAERACALEEAAGGVNLWLYLDTLARAQHLTGETASAIETQKRSVMLIPDGAPHAIVKELKTNLQTLEAASAASGP